VSAAPREKVVRVALAALRNLCFGRLDSLNAEMISSGLPKTLENLLERKWTDPELKGDLEYLHEALQNDSRDLRCVDGTADSGWAGGMWWR
jgi:V-type H+-transporting ATPase subunit H